MNQNWIVENLNNAFSTWNGKLTELWGLVTTSPQTFKGGAVWGVMQSLHNAMIGIGYALIVLFFAISLFKNTANFHELKRPEAAVHYLIRFVAAKTLVGYGMDIMLNIFSICNGVVSDMAAGMGGISQAMVALPGEVQSAIENVGFLASIPLWLVTILGSLFITVLSFIMIMSVYGRFFKLYLYTAIAPVPLSSLRESRARMSAGALSRVIVPCALRVQSSCLPALSFRCLRLPRPWSIPMWLRSRWCGAISRNWYSICSSLSVRSRWQTVSCVK